jgi:hypothetical protein
VELDPADEALQLDLSQIRKLMQHKGKTQPQMISQEV